MSDKLALLEREPLEVEEILELPVEEPLEALRLGLAKDAERLFGYKVLREHLGPTAEERRQLAQTFEELGICPLTRESVESYQKAEGCQSR